MWHFVFELRKVKIKERQKRHKRTSEIRKSSRALCAVATSKQIDILSLFKAVLEPCP